MARVRDYYEANTWKFVLFGAQGAIHRELWAETVKSKREAMHYVHSLVLERARRIPSDEKTIVDLGCGVGAAVFYLAERLPGEVHGVTISAAQVASARRWLTFRKRALRAECRFWEADFCALPPELRDVDLAFAIESFVHSSSAEEFFREAARTLQSGGQLLVIDDFLNNDGQNHSLVDEFKSGWHAPNVILSERARELAAPHGLDLVETVDLSPYQRLGRPRDRMIHALLPLIRRGARISYWCQSLVGGDALQSAHRLGLLSYKLLVFEKRAIAPSP